MYIMLIYFSPERGIYIVELKEKIKIIYSLDDEIFYQYFDGTTHYDERFGKKIDAPTFFYLDKDFNILMGNKNKNTIKDHVVNLSIKGFNVKVGPKCPLTETVEGYYIHNYNNDLLGIWRITTPQEKNKFRSLLLMQQADELFNSKNDEIKIETDSKIPDFTKDIPDNLKYKSISQRKNRSFRY